VAKPTVSTTFNAKDKLTRPINKMQKRIGGFAKFIGAAFVTGAAARGLTYFVKQASKIEDATASFTPLMGSVEKADDLVAALNKTAATTPFQFEDIADSAKQLLPVMNGNIENTIDTFRMLGDTAGGNAQKLDSITRGFMKSMLKGKVDMESLNMIAEAGVPIYSELADSMGVTVQEMMDMSRKGSITSDDLTRAFKKMTNEGGIFYKGMDIASKTLSGKLSTLKDNISLTAAEIGTQLLPTIKPLIDRMIEVAGRMREWVSANSELINQKIKGFIDNVTSAARFLSQQWQNGTIPAILGAVGAFKAVSIAITGAQGLLVAIKAVKMAMAAGSILSLANPVMAIAAVIAVAAGLIIKHWDKVKIFFIAFWEGLKSGFQNLWNFIKPVIDFAMAAGLIIKHWDKVKIFFIAFWEGLKSGFQNLWNFIKPVIDLITGVWDKVKGVFKGGGRQNITSGGLVSANQGMIESRSYSENRSIVDVNLNNLPPGSTARQRGKAPGVNLNYGFQGGM
jgi:tape measure domain-containing protein